MSVEQTPPNLDHTPDNETVGDRISDDRISDDIDRIHASRGILGPSFEQIEAGILTEDENLRGRFAELTVLLAELYPTDVAAVLESLPPRERNIIWLLVAPEGDGEVLLEVSDAIRETLIEFMDKDELLTIVDDLDADELAKLADDLPHQVVHEALQTRGEEEREQIKATMSYEDNRVDAIMDLELVSIRADVACEAVLRYLRCFDNLPDHTDKIFVAGEDDILQDVLPIHRPLIVGPENMVVGAMATDVVRFRPEGDVEETAQVFGHYNLVTAPVIDENKKLIGRTTIDEMVDVIREKSEADMFNMVGLQEEEDLFAPAWDSVKNRWVWPTVNLCTAFIASRVIGAFKGSIEKIAALAALMPIVTDISGNSGNQTITMTVRAMAMGQVTSTQAGRLLKKKVGVVLVNGVIWGTVMGVISWLLYGSIGIGLVMVATMTLNLLLAATVGTLIPVIMGKAGHDPALDSSVLITAITDSGGFLIFLGLTTLFLL